MNPQVLEMLIPLVALLSISAVVVVWFYFRHRARMATQDTIRLALERGSELSPEFMKQLGEGQPDKNRDLRRGLIWCGLALGFALLGVGVPDDEATRIMAGVAAMPFLIGCAYLLMYWISGKDES